MAIFSNSVLLLTNLPQLLQPKYTMHGFEWQNERGVEGTGFVRALRSLLTSHLPALLPRLESAVAVGMRENIEKTTQVQGDSRVLRQMPQLGLTFIVEGSSAPTFSS